ATSAPITRINGLAGSRVPNRRTAAHRATMIANGAKPRRQAAKPASSPEAGAAAGLAGPHHVNQASAAAANGSASASSARDTFVHGMLTPSAISSAGTFIGGAIMPAVAMTAMKAAIVASS